MKNPLTEQITKVQQLLFASETLQTYQRAFSLTVNILKEVLLLGWLTLCLSLVLIDWAKNWAIESGQRLKTWVTSLEQQEGSEIASSTGESILNSSKNVLNFLVGQAKSQIGVSTK